jgi:signal transduction histidine kinase
MGSLDTIIRRAETEIVVEVADRGEGLHRDRHHGRNLMPKVGVGIRGMTERVRQLGGRLDVTSGSQGTVVLVKLPIVRSSSMGAS